MLFAQLKASSASSGQTLSNSIWLILSRRPGATGTVAKLLGPLSLLGPLEAHQHAGEVVLRRAKDTSSAASPPCLRLSSQKRSTWCDCAVHRPRMPANRPVGVQWEALPDRVFFGVNDPPAFLHCITLRCATPKKRQNFKLAAVSLQNNQLDSNDNKKRDPRKQHSLFHKTEEKPMK